MVYAGDFRNGTTFEMDGSVYRVIEFQHVKPGKGAAFVRTKVKNIINNTTVEKTFSPSEKFDEAQITIAEMQYLYNDGNTYAFMDNKTFEQVELLKEELENILPYLKDNMNVTILSYKGKIFGVEPPTFIDLEVTYTEPGIKGATSTGQTKAATVETGVEFAVPLFVEIGDKIKIDTRTGEYMERC
ncbi:MAG: elongation factor P [Clostridia bacterium]|nr:elongation factor P [Clostridia bacterium]MDD4375326.1 elongation factor P [Clostridia bacterium]